MQALTGTESEIQQATAIRETILAAMAAAALDETKGAGMRQNLPIAAEAMAQTKTAAQWWIARRNRFPSELVGGYRDELEIAAHQVGFIGPLTELVRLAAERVARS